MPVDVYGSRTIDDEHDVSHSRLTDVISEDGEKKANFNVACLACRAVKTRCQNAGIGVKCSRCLRLKVTCEYREHRRGRRSTKPDKPHIVPPVVEAKDPQQGPEVATSDRDQPMDDSEPPMSAVSEAHEQSPSLPSPFGFYHAETPFSTSRISDLRNRPRSPSPIHTSSSQSNTELPQQLDRAQSPNFRPSPPPITIHHAQSPPLSVHLAQSPPIAVHHAQSHGLHPPPVPGPSRLPSDRQSSAGSCSTNSPPIASKRPRIRDFSVAGRLKTTKGLFDPERQQEQLDAADHWRDPVSMGIISEQEASQLVSSYFSHLNPFIALLDSALHTMPYLRHRSSLLFSSVLAVTAKFFLSTAIYHELLSMSKNLLNEAMGNDKCTLELIQSLSILCFWKECDDPTSWRKIGFAVRMAYELELHLVDSWSHTRLVNGHAELPENPTDAREMLNNERTWIREFLVLAPHAMIFYMLKACNLFHWLRQNVRHLPLHAPDQRNLLLQSMISYSTSSQHLKPEMIPQDLIPDVYAWAMSHIQTYPCFCDFQLAGANELSFTTSPLYHHMTRADLENEVTYTALLQQARTQHMQWRLKYRTSPDPRLLLDSISLTMLEFYDLWAEVKYREALCAQVSMFKTSHIDGRVHITSLQRCIELMNATMSLLDFVSGLFEPSVVMRHSQDIFAFRSAGAGLLLTKHAPRVGPDFVMSVRHAFAKIITAANKTSRHDKESTAYLARYFQQLLCRLNGQLSALPSRATSPTPHDAPMAANIGGTNHLQQRKVDVRPPSIFDHTTQTSGSPSQMVFDHHGYAAPSIPSTSLTQPPDAFPSDPVVDQLMADLRMNNPNMNMNGTNGDGLPMNQAEFTQVFPPTFGDDIYWLNAWPALSGLWQDGTGLGQLMAPQ